MASCVGDHERVLAPSVLHNLLLRSVSALACSCLDLNSLRTARFMFFLKKTLFDGREEQDFVSCLEQALSPSAFQFPKTMPDWALQRCNARGG